MSNSKMENPFKSNNTQKIVYTDKPINTPGIPIDKNSYTISSNLLDTEYSYGAGKEINETNMSGNVKSSLKILNNQTEILVYISQIIFNEVIENQNKIISKLEKENENNKINYKQELDKLKVELVAIKDQLVKTND